MPVAAAAPVAMRAPMATPPHMAPVTVGGVTVDPALLHMCIPDDEPMLDDVEMTEEEASALESELVHLGMAPSPSSSVVPYLTMHRALGLTLLLGVALCG